MKFALVSNVLPPSETSHATVIHRLLRDFDPATYCLLSPREYVPGKQPNYSGWLPGKYYYLPPVFQLRRGYRLGMRLIRERVNLAMGIVLRGRAIARILKREKCDALVVCTGGNEILDFPAGYLASRLVGARFYAYLLDQYFDMVAALVGKSFVQRLEPLLLKGASGVIAPNEFLRDEIRRRYGIEAVVIHNSCDLSVYENARGSEEYGAAPGHGEVRIVYTGAVGIVHYDAFRNLMAAINLLDRKNMKLHLYTAQPRLDLEREGIHGQMVYHEHEPVSAMPGIQQQADILFLPLAFNSPYPEIVRTAAPGKMGEFLAAGRPILVHAPADSFLSWYFRKHECGLVVDEDDPAALARALGTLLHDAAQSKRLSERARERATTDFALPTARDRFARVLGFQVPV
jgi:glycosyltransferase involved in cell wall biosynthesis